MRRRQFLKTTAATAVVAAASGPIILGAEDKAGSKNPVLGVEGHKYEVTTHDWGTLPGELEWQTSHNVTIDSQGHVYVTQQGLKGRKVIDTIYVFDDKGQFVRSFGKEFHEGGHGVEVRKEGSDEFLYLSNTWTPKLKLMKTTLKGEVVWTKGRPECDEYKDPKKPYNPTNICFTPDGGFIVGDGYGSNYLLKYDKDAKLVKVFGGTGTALGQMRTPHGNWIDARDPNNPVLIVCDRANARLQTFDLDGKPLSATESGKVVLFPAHAKTRGDVLLVPDLHARVSLFGKGNELIAHLGDDAEWRKKVLGMKIRSQPKEWPAGKFIHPHDAAFDKDGNIIVVEWVSTGRVSFLKKVG
jgi:DNA-binding beta-propeller fold protein YncE